jgi:ABC-type polysaccharide/polyol phosphate export systems, permease component
MDLRLIRRRRLEIVAASLVLPFIYILAFGYGLGKGVNLDGVSYVAFVVPGVVALTAMTSSFNGAASKLNVDRIFHKSFDEILMAPVSHFSIIIGKALIGVIRGLISSLAVMAVGVVISPTLQFSPFFLLLLLLICFMFSLLGELVALTARNHQDLNTFNTFVLLPMTFLSGTFFSLSQIPAILKTALYILPLTHSSQCLRASALGQPLPLVSVFVLLGFAVAFFAGCVFALRRNSV